MATGRSHAARFGIQFRLVMIDFIGRDGRTLAERLRRSTDYLADCE